MAKKNVLLITGSLLHGFQIHGPMTANQSFKVNNIGTHYVATLMDRGADDTDMDDCSAGGKYVVLAGELSGGFNFYGPCDAEGSDSLCEALGRTYPHVMTVELTRK